MILFTILTIMVVLAAVLAIIFAGTIGGATIVVFDDLIVFAAIMWLIIKLIFRKKK